MLKNKSIEKTDANTVQVCCEPECCTTESTASTYVPQIDVLEHQDKYTIVCDAPGIDAETINLTFENGIVKLNGPVANRYPENVKFLSQEYGVGGFHREISLGRLVEFADVENISADYKQGVLTIHLPKLDAAKPRKIAVQAS